jgi:hypothetical protein
VFLGNKPGLLVSRPRHPPIGDLDRDVRQAPHTLDAHLVGVALAPVEHPQPRRAEAEGRVRGEAGAEARAQQEPLGIGRRLRGAVPVARHAERPQLVGEHADSGLGVARHHADVEVPEARHGVGCDGDAGGERATADAQVLQRWQAGEEEVLAQHGQPYQRQRQLVAWNGRPLPR